MYTLYSPIVNIKRRDLLIYIVPASSLPLCLTYAHLSNNIIHAYVLIK